MASDKLKTLLRQGNITEVKNESDTIKLWESYRQQALLWRAIALLQIPATALAVLLTLLLWSTRSITLQVPSQPKPGTYAAQDIPDTEFINFAQDFVNLLASYQQNNARRQYERASMMVMEPYLSQFKEQMLSFELRAIETTTRTQFFFPDPYATKVTREGKFVLVTFTGDRLKLIAGQELPLLKTKFLVQLTTLPKNPLNPYGIAVSGFTAEEPK